MSILEIKRSILGRLAHSSFRSHGISQGGFPLLLTPHWHIILLERQDKRQWTWAWRFALGFVNVSTKTTGLLPKYSLASCCYRRVEVNNESSIYTCDCTQIVSLRPRSSLGTKGSCTISLLPLPIRVRGPCVHTPWCLPGTRLVEGCRSSRVTHDDGDHTEQHLPV